MKVLHINSLTRGGAARACINLHLGLMEQNIDSRVLFLGDSEEVGASASYWEFHEEKIFEEIENRALLEKVRTKMQTFMGTSAYAHHQKHQKMMEHISSTRDKRYEVFSSPHSLYQITKHPYYREADIVHLHWVNNFLDFSEFFTNNTKPLFWTLHDMFPFTGGCSFSMDCEQFLSTCKICPQLVATGHPDYVEKLFQYKYSNLQKNSQPLQVITPSRWMGSNSRKSKLLGQYPHHVIPYGVETSAFHIGHRAAAKRQLGIDEQKIVALFVSDHVTNHRKGTQFIFPIVRELDKLEGLNDLLFITVGGGEVSLGAQHRHLGLISGVEGMAKVYAAADVFICPSLEDNFPNTVLEAQLTGTPVIGFPSGGIPEMIQDGKNGLIVPEVSSDALLRTIQNWRAVKDQFDHRRIAADAFEKYTLEVQAKRMIELYKTVL